MIFPRLVYKTGGRFEFSGGSYDYAYAENQDDYDALIADGWFDNLADALNPPVKKTIGKK